MTWQDILVFIRIFICIGISRNLCGILGASQLEEDNKWPEGWYGLPQPKKGCPTGVWNSTGWLSSHSNSDASSRKSSPFHLKGVFTSTETKRYFCMKQNTSQAARVWPPGQYCIYRFSFRNCTPGFETGYITWKGSSDNKMMHPDGLYASNTTINYCCRTDGSKDIPISLPITKPFFLFAYNSITCQSVKGTTSTQEFVRYSEQDLIDQSGCHPFVDEHNSIRYCYYAPTPATTTTSATSTHSEKPSTTVAATTKQLTTTKHATTTTTTTTATTTTTTTKQPTTTTKHAKTTTHSTTTKQPTTTTTTKQATTTKRLKTKTPHITITTVGITTSELLSTSVPNVTMTTINGTIFRRHGNNKKTLLIATLTPVFVFAFLVVLITMFVRWLRRRRRQQDLGLYLTLPISDETDFDENLCDGEFEELIVEANPSLELTDGTSQANDDQDTFREQNLESLGSETELSSSSCPHPNRYESDPDPNHSKDIANKEVRLLQDHDAAEPTETERLDMKRLLEEHDGSDAPLPESKSSRSTRADDSHC